eukprot:8429153-Karenia_brevis.AAC.1
MAKQKCRFSVAGCPGVNPYLQNLVPAVSHTSGGTPSSLISPNHIKACTKFGITGLPAQEDIDMGEAGDPPPTPPVPVADAFIKKTQQQKRMKELHQTLLEELGEEDPSVIALQAGLDKFTSQ